MLRNYLLTAWRNIIKNRVYTLINILCLVVGLTVFVFGSMLIDYERHYDSFFANADRIMTVGTVFTPEADIGVKEFDGTYSAVQPLIKAQVPGVTLSARTFVRKFLVTQGDFDYYENLHFADPELTQILTFDYVEGDVSALQDPHGLIVTQSLATKYFGAGPYLGEVLTLDHQSEFHVNAVIKDLPRNSHLSASIMNQDGEFSAIVSTVALEALEEFDPGGNWRNLSNGELTYVMLPEGKTQAWFQAAIDGIYASHLPEDQLDFIASFRVRPLGELNTAIWDMIGLPMIESVQLLALLVLIVAIVNYTNLATAQSLGRAKEVGLRKTMGATRVQLLQQFLVESITFVAIAMLITLVLLEFMVPAFNVVAGRDMTINYAEVLAWLLATIVIVGVVAGAYPAYMITRTTPIEALRNGKSADGNGGFFRSAMLGLQFTISIFMLGMVMVFYVQNSRIEASGNIFPRAQVYNLERLDVEEIRGRHDVLRNELLALPGVEAMAYSHQIPFQQGSSAGVKGRIKGDETSGFSIMNIVISSDFFHAYDMPLLAGRDLDEAYTDDFRPEGSKSLNVVLNELAVEKLGFASPQDAIGEVFYNFPEPNDEGDVEPLTHTIVGVVPALNFQGFHNTIKPMMYFGDREYFRIASVRIKPGDMAGTIDAIERVWGEVIPDYPIQGTFLNETFGDTFSIFRDISRVMASFAFLATALSMMGLFGVAAFMAAQRTREIGIRKVMGASIPQIIKLLIWQFSKPVIWGLLFALPLTYLASGYYLESFADRVAYREVLILIAGSLSVVFAWAIVAVHAIRIARLNPIHALRYE
jgi:putative ABC transport system permease protein